MARPTANSIVTRAMIRLGLRAEDRRTSSVYVGGHRLSGSRVEIPGLPALFIQGIRSGSKVDHQFIQTKLLASLAGRLPVLAVLKEEELIQVRMPGWAFAALLRMALKCPAEEVETVLSTYLPLGASIPATDRLVGSGILSALEEAAQSLSSTSFTD